MSAREDILARVREALDYPAEVGSPDVEVGSSAAYRTTSGLDRDALVGVID